MNYKLKTCCFAMCCAAICSVFPAHAETPMEKSNRILKEIDDRVINQYRTTTPNVDAMPKPSTTASPEDMARQFSQSPIKPKAITSELMIFVSFSMPRESLLRIVEQSEKTGAKLVFRGFMGDKLTEMSKRIAGIIGTHRVEALVHPPAFTQFNINQVPALVIAQSNAGDQMQRGCAQADRFVKVTGDVSQDYALDYIERNSPQWAATARTFNLNIAGGLQ